VRNKFGNSCRKFYSRIKTVNLFHIRRGGGGGWITFVWLMVETRVLTTQSCFCWEKDTKPENLQLCGGTISCIRLIGGMVLRQNHSSKNSSTSHSPAGYKDTKLAVLLVKRQTKYPPAWTIACTNYCTNMNACTG
jgi:hypothetical protein